MASYTMQLREYIEMWSQNETLSTRDQIEKGRTNLFDFDYPIFDVSNYKKSLKLILSEPSLQGKSVSKQKDYSNFI
jgi:hypothetical protein